VARILSVLIFCTFPLIAIFAQAPSPSSVNSNESAAQSSPTPRLEDHMRDGLKSMAEESQTLTGWGLAIIGASIIGMASTSYLRPPRRRVRLIYLLFIPGWLFIAWSVYNGDKISRHYSAAVFARNRELLGQIGSLMNTQFDQQLTHLQWGLGFFALWLLVFAIWWIFSDLPAVP
jgi:hypothetical protein